MLISKEPMKAVLKAIIADIKKLNEAAKTYMTAVDEIASNDETSNLFKEKEIEQTRAEYEKAIAPITESIQKNIDLARQEEQNLNENFDYQNPELQDAITLISGVGTNLPSDTYVAISESFRGYMRYLATLEAIYNRYGFELGHIREMISPLQCGFASNFDDMIYYAMQNPDSLGDHARMTARLREFVERYANCIGVTL